MNISLEIIRNVLRNALGHESFIAGFVSLTVEDRSATTACINPEGVIRYNPEFVKNNVKTEQDLFSLVFHEILHPAFGHFIYQNDEITNIACDAIINSVISNLYHEESDHGALFARLYPDRGLTGILRPGSKLGNSRFFSVYHLLYPDTNGRFGISSGELIQTLKALISGVSINVVLLGSHGGGPVQKWPASLQKQIGNDILSSLSQNGRQAGRYDGLQRLLVEVLKSNKSIREHLLLNYSTRKKLDAFFDIETRPTRITSPFPLNPSRRDLVMLSAGIWPGLFHNRQKQRSQRKKGIAIFLDVSGSVNSYLPKIIGLLSRFRDRLTSVYLFSNSIAETSFSALCNGRIRTTYGTDFDCIADRILEDNLDRAVVITDGYASLNKEKASAMQDIKTRVLTILFGGKTTCPELCPFGDIVLLENAIT